MEGKDMAKEVLTEERHKNDHHHHEELCGCGHDHHHEDACGCGHNHHHEDACGCGHVILYKIIIKVPKSNKDRADNCFYSKLFM